MGIIEIINVPLLLGAFGILLFFIWLGRYADRIDKKRKKPPSTHNVHKAESASSKSQIRMK